MQLLMYDFSLFIRRFFILIFQNLKKKKFRVLIFNMSWIFILTRTVLWSEINTELTGLMWELETSFSAPPVSIDADCGVGSRLWDSDAKAFPPFFHRAFNCDALFFPCAQRAL